MAATRPYFLVFKGEKHIIEAPAAANAVQHVVGADVSELRPARAAEVSAWLRAGNAIPVFGEKTAIAASASAAEPDPARENYDHHDATNWLIEQPGYSASATACAAWGEVVTSRRMTLEHFDIIRTAAPRFAEAFTVTGDAPAIPVDAVRETLEDNPASLDDVVHAIGQAKRRDLYAGEMDRTNGGEERMIGDSGHSAEQ